MSNSIYPPVVPGNKQQIPVDYFASKPIEEKVYKVDKFDKKIKKRKPRPERKIRGGLITEQRLFAVKSRLKATQYGLTISDISRMINLNRTLIGEIIKGYMKIVTSGY